MPAAIKRRKVAATTSRNATSSLNKPRGIDSFTRVSKATTTTKVVIEKNYSVDAIATAQLEEYITVKGKRKPITTGEESATISSAIEGRIIKPLPQRKSNNTLRKQITNTQPPSSGSSTKSTENLLDQLFVSAKATSQPQSDTRPPAPAQDLPIELLDLINLHAAFLTALSLHYAHNGTSSPADLRFLCPDVARAWGKRAVKMEDIRRTLGVMNTNISAGKNEASARLSLADYGYGKICLEIEEAEGMIQLLDENLLNGIFVRGLKKAWANKQDDMKVKEFILSLPMESITKSSLAKMSPLLAKGQRRLEDLRAGIIIKKEAKQQAIEEPSGKKMSLLERLRAKQLHQSTLPAPPSKAQLSRKAALQRIEEVAGVLSILSTSSSVGQQRISFTLPTVLGKLKDSFKNPMSRAEGEMCLRVLADDVAPDWVKIVKMGKVEALVVNRDERPNELDIRERVKCAACVGL